MASKKCGINGSVAKNILAATSCIKANAAASISCVVGNSLQHYPPAPAPAQGVPNGIPMLIKKNWTSGWLYRYLMGLASGS